jgi:alkylation response protein AidB-like acyl-CoA dehydrogenase
MDLELTDEQTWLAESVSGLLDRPAGDGAWEALVEFGALQIASGEDGLGAVELALIAHALGERLLATPFVATAATRYATRSLRGSAHAAFAELHEGTATVALALMEARTSWDLEQIATRLDDDDRVEGEKLPVEHADGADLLLVLATDGDRRRLALVPAEQATRSPAPSLDAALPTSSVALSGAPAAALPADLGEQALDRLLAIGSVLAAAEAVGAAGSVLRLACEYAGERRQFGRRIGSFQALRHLLADMHVWQTSSWSTVLFAAAALEDEIEDARRTARVAKAYASRATLDVAHGALQVFGGIAFTDEHPAHLYLRRIISRARDFGDARHHERAIGRALAGAGRLQEVPA